MVQNPVHRSFRWNGYWACLKAHTPSGAPALALYCPNPPQSVPRASPLPRQSLAVTPLIADQRGDGEALAR